MQSGLQIRGLPRGGRNDQVQAAQLVRLGKFPKRQPTMHGVSIRTVMQTVHIQNFGSVHPCKNNRVCNIILPVGDEG